MKQIKKQVLTEKDVFVAEDGTEFEDEHHCLNYEIRLQEKKEKADFLEKFGIVNLSEEHHLISSSSDEDVYLCHMENENDVILLAHAFDKLEIDDEKYFIESVKNEMQENNLSFPINFAVVDYCGDCYVYHDWLNEYIDSVNKVKNKIDDFMAKNGGK